MWFTPSMMSGHGGRTEQFMHWRLQYEPLFTGQCLVWKGCYDDDDDNDDDDSGGGENDDGQEYEGDDSDEMMMMMMMMTTTATTTTVIAVSDTCLPAPGVINGSSGLKTGSLSLSFRQCARTLHSESFIARRTALPWST